MGGNFLEGMTRPAIYKIYDIYDVYTYDIRYERGPVGIFIEGGVQQNDPSGRNLSLWSGKNRNCQNPHNALKI